MSQWLPGGTPCRELGSHFKKGRFFYSQRSWEPARKAVWHRPTRDQLQVEGLSSEPGGTLPVVSHKFRVAYFEEPRTRPAKGICQASVQDIRTAVPNRFPPYSPYSTPWPNSQVGAPSLAKRLLRGVMIVTGLGGAQVLDLGDLAPRDPHFLKTSAHTGLWPQGKVPHYWTFWSCLGKAEHCPGHREGWGLCETHFSKRESHQPVACLGISPWGSSCRCQQPALFLEKTASVWVLSSN